jgi:RHS repeat-associated protein
LDKVSWTGPGGAAITTDEVARTVGGDIVNQLVDGVDHHAGNDYGYDNANRLTEAWVPGRHLSYRYNATGGCGSLTTAGANTNRTSQIIEGGATTSYCYDRADRLTSATDAAVGTIAYDGHGNTTTIFGETHAYDAADRHMSTVKGATTVTYKRDATDRIVERKLNGTVVARYGSTGSGDISDFTTDANNALVEVTFPLPGGAMLTTRAAGNVWSYPNVHGDVVATTNQAGAKQGSTTKYDPYGNLVSGALPDNSTGNLDYGWLGQHQRPLEHETALQPIIEMGARQYSPLLGRFLEVDPIEGGSANDYDYTNANPISGKDLTGTWPGNGILKRLRGLVAKLAKTNKKVARFLFLIKHTPRPFALYARFPKLTIKQRARVQANRLFGFVQPKQKKETPYYKVIPSDCSKLEQVALGLFDLLATTPGGMSGSGEAPGPPSAPGFRGYFCAPSIEYLPM